MVFLPEMVRQRLKNVPFREMFCPWCKGKVKAAPWWTSDEGMLDWYCGECFEPIETVEMRRGERLIDYFGELWNEEALF